MILELILISQVITQVGGNTLVNGTAMTWTNGQYTWAGNPYCAGEGYNYTLQPNSPAIDAGDKNCHHIDTFMLECMSGPDDTPPNSIFQVETYHCPNPGSALNQPRLPDPWASYCLEWYGAGPDIGACEFVPQMIPQRPNTLGVGVQ